MEEKGIRYVSLDAAYGEPLLVARAAAAAASASVSLDVNSFEDWDEYPPALAKSGFCTVLSTHGASIHHDERQERWEFGSTRIPKHGKALWQPLRKAFPAQPAFGARLLIVLACHAQQADWTPYLQPGSFAIVARGRITTLRCAEALEQFIARIPSIDSDSLNEAILREHWPNWTQFKLVATEGGR